MKNVVILVHGKTHSGKGVFSDFLHENLLYKDLKKINVIQCSLSSYIRNLVKDFYYEGDFDSNVCREFMAKVYEYGDKLYPFHKSRRVWENDIKPNLKNQLNVIIVESFREKVDYIYFKKLLEENEIHDIISLKIQRDNFEIPNYINKSHISENDLNDFQFDYIILNNTSLFSLKNKAENLSNILRNNYI